MPILVVSAEDGVMPQTKEHINLIASISGITQIIVFINKCDLVSDIEIEFVQAEVDSILESKNMTGTYIYGSALLASKAQGEEYSNNKYAMPAIQALCDAIDKLGNTNRDYDKPFVMYISDTRTVVGRGVVLTGRVTYGKAKKDDELYLVGMGKKTRKVIVSSVQAFHKEIAECRAGDDVGILPRCPDIKSREDVQKGEVLLHDSALKEGIVTITNQFKASIYVLTKDEGGRHTAFVSGFQPQLFIQTAAITATIKISDTKDVNNTVSEGMLMPGDHAEVIFELQRPMAISLGTRFAGRENNQTVLSGVITQLLPEIK